MSLEVALESLGTELTRLRDAVSALHVTVTEDKPLRGGVVLVDQLDNVVTDLCGSLDEADARVAVARQTTQSTGALDTPRVALREIHARLNDITGVYSSELASYDRIARLLKMGHERGREWREWSQEVKTGVERCEVPLRAVARATVECWSELADRLARNSVSLQATNIGQQITVRDDQWALSARSE